MLSITPQLCERAEGRKHGVELTCHNPNRLTLEGSVVRVRPTGASLTNGDKDELAIAFTTGTTLLALAERYGVSPSMVKSVLRERGARRQGLEGTAEF